MYNICLQNVMEWKGWVAENGNTLVKHKYLILVPNCSTYVTFHLWLTRQHNSHSASSAVTSSPIWCLCWLLCCQRDKHWHLTARHCWVTQTHSATTGGELTPLRLTGWIYICMSVATCITTGQKCVAFLRGNIIIVVIISHFKRSPEETDCQETQTQQTPAVKLTNLQVQTLI